MNITGRQAGATLELMWPMNNLHVLRHAGSHSLHTTELCQSGQDPLATVSAIRFTPYSLFSLSHGTRCKTLSYILEPPVKLALHSKHKLLLLITSAHVNHTGLSEQFSTSAHKISADTHSNLTAHSFFCTEWDALPGSIARIRLCRPPMFPARLGE